MPRFSDHEDKVLKDLWQQGKSDALIADRLGRSRGSIRRRAERFGLKPLTVVRHEATPDYKIRRALEGIVDHWNEFGEMMINNQDDYGFEERIDVATDLLRK